MMKININMSNASQCEKMHDSMKYHLYKELHKAAKKDVWWIRPAAIPLTVASSLLSVVKRVALIAENILKGLGNILGCMFFKQCSLSRGIRQILVGALGHPFCLPFTFLNAVLKVCFHSIGMLYDPVGHTRGQEQEYDPNPNYVRKRMVTSRRESEPVSLPEPELPPFLMPAEEKPPVDLLNFSKDSHVHITVRNAEEKQQQADAMPSGENKDMLLLDAAKCYSHCIFAGSDDQIQEFKGKSMEFIEKMSSGELRDLALNYLCVPLNYKKDFLGSRETASLIEDEERRTRALADADRLENENRSAD